MKFNDKLTGRAVVEALSKKHDETFEWKNSTSNTKVVKSEHGRTFVYVNGTLILSTYDGADKDCTYLEFHNTKKRKLMHLTQSRLNGILYTLGANMVVVRRKRKLRLMKKDKVTSDFSRSFVLKMTKKQMKRIVRKYRK